MAPVMGAAWPGGDTVLVTRAAWLRGGHGPTDGGCMDQGGTWCWQPVLHGSGGNRAPVTGLHGSGGVMELVMGAAWLWGKQGPSDRAAWLRGGHGTGDGGCMARGEHDLSDRGCMARGGGSPGAGDRLHGLGGTPCSLVLSLQRVAPGGLKV